MRDWNWNTSIPIIFILLMGMLTSSGEAVTSPLLPTGAPGNGLTMVAVNLSFSAAEPVMSIQQDGSTRLTIENYDNVQTTGALDIPYSSKLIAVPANAEVSLEITESQWRSISLPGPLARVKETPVLMDGEFVNRIKQPTMMSDMPLPADVNSITFEEIGIMRGVRLARLTFYPLRPFGNGLRFVSQVEVTVNFTANPSTLNPGIANDPLLDAVRAEVVNPEHVVPVERIAQTDPMQPDQPTATNRAAIIEVTKTGITEITYEALNSAGFPVDTVIPQNLSVKLGGGEIRIFWDGDDDTIFETTERILFYSEPRLNRWARSDNYYLEEGNAPGLRMTDRAADPVSLTAGDAKVTTFFETNVFYYSSTDIPAGHDGEKWAWDFLQQPTRTLRSFYPEITAADLTKPAEINIWLTGFTDPFATPDHLVDITLNSVSLGTAEWNGYQTITKTLPILAGGLVNGSNTMDLSLPGITGVPVEGNYIDAFEISYVLGAEIIGETVRFVGELNQRKYTANLQSSPGIQAFDVTNTNEPIRLTDIQISSNSVTIGDPTGNSSHVYFVTTENGIIGPDRVRLKRELTSQQYGFDGGEYLIIMHDDFAGALDDLINLRTSKGLDVTTEAAQAIYDNYSEGIPSPEGIKAYISSAYTFWPTRPIYVLLIGDGSYDPKRYLTSTVADTFIPPFLADVDPWIGETASDNLFVTVDGADKLPDLIIGRFPVTTVAELQAIIAKTIAYEQEIGGTDWRKDTVFIADNTDSGGNFSADADYVINEVLTPEIRVDKIYHSTSITETQNAITTSLNLGKGFVNYFGHSSTHQWAFERFFHKDDTPSLANTNRLSIFVQMTCLTGKFQEAGGSVLDENLLLLPGAGAVSVWGPTGFGLATGHQHLSEGFYNSLLVNKNPSVGAAALAGKLFLAGKTSSYMDLVDTFTYLGDPALNYYSPLINTDYGVFLPIITR